MKKPIQFITQVLFIPVVLLIVPGYLSKFILADFVDHDYALAMLNRVLPLVLTLFVAFRLVKVGQIVFRPLWMFVLALALFISLIGYSASTDLINADSRFEWGTILGYTLITSVLEEFLFRVVVFVQVVKFFGSSEKHLSRSVLVTSIIFALSHAIGFSVTEGDYMSLFNTMVLTFGAGVLLQGLFLRFNNILFPIFIHFANNYRAAMGSLTEADSQVVEGITERSVGLIAMNIAVFLGIGLIFFFLSQFIIKGAGTTGRVAHLKALNIQLDRNV